MVEKVAPDLIPGIIAPSLKPNNFQTLNLVQERLVAANYCALTQVRGYKPLLQDIPAIT